MEVDDGQIIKGESMLGHETAHAREAYAKGQKIVYIVTPFIWKQSEDGTWLKASYSGTKFNKNLSLESKIDISIAPIFPSFDDLMQARRMLKDLDNPIHPTLEETTSM